MSAVREQEELQREGAADFVAIEIVGRTPWELFWVRFKRDRVALGALVFILLLVLIALFAGPISRWLGHPPNAQDPTALDAFGTPTGPSAKYIFGVDQIGRDVFSRVLFDARVSLEVALIATVVSVSIGVVLGMTAGYFRGWVDTVISRLIFDPVTTRLKGCVRNTMRGCNPRCSFPAGARLPPCTSRGCRTRGAHSSPRASPHPEGGSRRTAAGSASS